MVAKNDELISVDEDGFKEGEDSSYERAIVAKVIGGAAVGVIH